MRIIYLIKKSIKEILRDWKILIFALIFGPLFVTIFHAFFASKPVSYKVAIINLDQKVTISQGSELNAGNELIKILKDKKNSDASSFFNITIVSDNSKAIKDLNNKKYDVLITIPKDFSQSIVKQLQNQQTSETTLFITGDMASQKYMVPSITIGGLSDALVNSITGRTSSVKFIEKSIIDYKGRSEFDSSIPSAIFLGIIMLLFTASIALIREVDSGTIRRLQISRASSGELLAAITISQLLIGIVSIILTLFTALRIFGSKSEGALGAVFLISLLTCLAIIAISFILAGFSRTTSDILIIGNFPYFLLFLFSGAFPLPRLNLFTLKGHSFAINDIFPTTPAMTALNAIMNQGKTLYDVAFELILVIVLTILYLILGIYVFNKKHMKLA